MQNGILEYLFPLSEVVIPKPCRSKPGRASWASREPIWASVWPLQTDLPAQAGDEEQTECLCLIIGLLAIYKLRFHRLQSEVTLQKWRWGAVSVPTETNCRLLSSWELDKGPLGCFLTVGSTDLSQANRTCLSIISSIPSTSNRHGTSKAISVAADLRDRQTIFPLALQRNSSNLTETRQWSKDLSSNLTSASCCALSLFYRWEVRCKYIPTL